METNDPLAHNPLLSERGQRDLALVVKALEGDQRAFTILMTAYRAQVFRLMLRMVPNRDDADDLTVEAFSKAFIRLNQYRSEFAFSTWLFKIATNNCIDFLRRKRHQKTLSIDAPQPGAEGKSRPIDVQSEGLDPEQEVMKLQRAVEMHRLVESLPPKYRQLVELRYFDERSYEEIAQYLDLPLGTVKAHLFRARELMLGVMRHTKERI